MALSCLCADLVHLTMNPLPDPASGLGFGTRVCRRVAHKRKYLATGKIRVHRSMTMGRWSQTHFNLWSKPARAGGAAGGRARGPGGPGKPGARSRGLSAPHPRRWAAEALSLGFHVTRGGKNGESRFQSESPVSQLRASHPRP